jgi:hypothetical protein
LRKVEMSDNRRQRAHDRPGSVRARYPTRTVRVTGKCQDNLRSGLCWLRNPNLVVGG